MTSNLTESAISPTENTRVLVPDFSSVPLARTSHRGSALVAVKLTVAAAVALPGTSSRYDDSSDENAGTSDPALGTSDTSDAVSSGVETSSLVALAWSVPSFAGWSSGKSSR